MISRTGLLATATLLLHLGCGRSEAPPGSGGAPAADRRVKAPDVVLVTIDTLRRDHLPTYGYPRPTAPHLDSLAPESITFDAAYAHAPATGPALACLMTGLWPVDTTVGSNADALPAELLTLAELLRTRGYETAAVVSNVILVRDSGFGQGFSTYDDRYTDRECARPIAERPAGSSADAAVQAWRSLGPGPRLLWVHFNDPHGPYKPDATTFLDPPPRFAGPPRLARGEDDTGAGAIPAYQWVEGDSDPRSYVNRYDDEIRQMDAGLGKLLSELRRDPARFDRSLVFVTADHGESIGEDAHWFAHGHACAEELLAVPLAVKLPGSTQTGRRGDAVSHADILPTVCEVLGLATPPAARGRSLLSPGAARTFLAQAGPGESRRPHRALLAPPLRLIRYDDGARVLLRQDEDGACTVDDAGAAEALSVELDALERPRVSPAAARRSLEEEQLREMRRLGYLN